MEARFVEEFGDRWQDAVNRQAVDEIVNLCAENIRLDDPGLGETAVGVQAVQELFARIWRAFPDLRFTRPKHPYLVAPGGSVVGARWSAVGTMRGRVDPPGYAPTGSVVEFHGVDIWEFDDQFLSYWEGIYDAAEIGRQIGALPPRGSRGERVGAMLQQLSASRIRRAH